MHTQRNGPKPREKMSLGRREAERDQFLTGCDQSRSHRFTLNRYARFSSFFDEGTNESKWVASGYLATSKAEVEPGYRAAKDQENGLFKLYEITVMLQAKKKKTAN